MVSGMASRAREHKRMPQQEKPDLGAAAVQLDFMYALQVQKHNDEYKRDRSV